MRRKARKDSVNSCGKTNKQTNKQTNRKPFIFHLALPLDKHKAHNFRVVLSHQIRVQSLAERDLLPCEVS